MEAQSLRCRWLGGPNPASTKDWRLLRGALIHRSKHGSKATWARGPLGHDRATLERKGRYICARRASVVSDQPFSMCRLMPSFVQFEPQARAHLSILEFTLHMPVRSHNVRPLVEVKSRKARCYTPCHDTAAIERTNAKYICMCCIPTTLILGIIAAFRAFQHSFYSVQLLFFLFPVAMVPLLKLILKESRAQYTGLMLCVFSCGMTAILAVNLESMVSFGNEDWRTQLVDTIGEFTARGEVTFAQDVENTFVAAVVDQAMSYNPISSTLVFPFMLLNTLYAFVIVPFQYLILPQIVPVKDGPGSGHRVLWSLLSPTVGCLVFVLTMVC